MTEIESGKAKGKLKKLCKKRQQEKEFSVDDGSISSPQLSDIESSSSKSYVIEWLCAHPYPSTPLALHSPPEDPPSFHDIYHHNLEKVPSINSSSTSFMVNRRRSESVAEMFCHMSTSGMEKKEEMLSYEQLEKGECNQSRNPAQPGISCFMTSEGQDYPCVSHPNGLNNYAQTIRYCNCGHSEACRHGKKCFPSAANPVGSPEKLSSKPGRKENKISFYEDHGDQVKLDLEKGVKLDNGNNGKGGLDATGGVNPEESQLAKGDTWSTGAGEQSKETTGMKISSVNHKGKSHPDQNLKTLGITVSVGATEYRQNTAMPAPVPCKLLNVTHRTAKHQQPPENQLKETCMLIKCQGTKAKVGTATGKGQCLKGSEQSKKPDASPSTQESRLASSERLDLEKLDFHAVEPKKEAGLANNIKAGEDVLQLSGGLEKLLTRQRSLQASALAEHLEGGEVSRSGSGSQDVGEEDLENRKLNKRLDSSEVDKDIHVSEVHVSLEKMTTEEVCEWLIDSGFQSCVQHVKELGMTCQHLVNTDPKLFVQLKLQGDQNQANEQQVEEPWTTKERNTISGSEKGTGASGAAIPLERMTTNEVCKWLTDSGFQAFVPHIREFGITGQQLANTDSELFDQLQLRDAEDRERLLFALYQELNPSDMNVEEILGNTNIDSVFSSVELPIGSSEAWISEGVSKGENMLQENSSCIILEDSQMESRMKSPTVDKQLTNQPHWTAQETTTDLPQTPPTDFDNNQINLLSQRVLELAQAVETRLQEAGRQIRDLELRKPLDAALLETKLNSIQRMMEEMEGSIQQTEKRKQAFIRDNGCPAKVSVEGAILELHFVQQKLALIQLKEQYTRNMLQNGKKALSSVVPSSGQLLQVHIDMDFREWGFTVNIDSTGVPMVTSSAIPTLTTGDLLIEVNGISMLDCSIEELEQALGEVSIARILVLRSGEKVCIKSMEEACSLENALTELTTLQSEFIAATVELSALRNEKGVMWSEIEKLRARESLLLQENKRVLQSADSLKQLLERSEYRWMFLKEQLEAMKGAFQLEKKKLDSVEIKLKDEIDALKSKSCQDDKKIKDLATALKEKSATSEQMKITQRHKYQVDVTERNWLPEQLEELQMFGKQCQHLQHTHNQAQHLDQEWTYPQSQWVNYQCTHLDPKCQSTQSQWLDHQACGDQQLQCSPVQHLEDPVYNPSDDWPCPQAEWFRVQAHHPDQKLHCLQGQWLNHQPHCSQQDLPSQQSQCLDCLVQYPNQELRCQQGQWLHYQRDHLGQLWFHSKDKQPGFKSNHSDQELQVQQKQSTDCLQGSEQQFQQDQSSDHLNQQAGNQPDHQIHSLDQQGQESNIPSDLDEEEQNPQVSQQQQSQQAHHQSNLDQIYQGQKHDPQADHLNQGQQGQCLNHQKCNAMKSTQLSKLHPRSLTHQKDQPGSKTQQQTKLPPRTHVCRRSRHHQTRSHCSQSKLPKEHLLQLSVKLGEHLPSMSQNKQKSTCEKETLSPVLTRQHRKKRTSHHSANERHPFSDDVFGPDIKLHKEQRTEVILTSQDTSKETAAKKKQLAQLLQMVASHTSHLLKDHVAQNN
ncbi:uncharacterized protein LOC119979694 isoform X2 [Scyliorhinus canicula]|uniref:uncharacterized protein LOC119979694 isoform X2 n=1 Tax=Scyliorhinus canicula TaxID=7830 RepID=UPI0018F2A1AA|nr:uncharacterized protein LOC119979694 isoform X2 [Scyliorhinus canicula]